MPLEIVASETPRGNHAIFAMGALYGVPDPVAGKRPAIGVGEDAAYGTRTAVRRSVAGYCYSTLARSARWDRLLHLSAFQRTSFSTINRWLCAIRSQHDRLGKLHARTATAGGRAESRGTRAEGCVTRASKICP